jgi:hypothetical protein
MTTEELNNKIRALCEAKGMTFKPWECPPWQAREGRVKNDGTAWAESYPKAQALRRKLIAEIEEAARTPHQEPGTVQSRSSRVLGEAAVPRRPKPPGLSRPLS